MIGFFQVGKSRRKSKDIKMSTNYTSCDKCGSEFIIKDLLSTTLRCPDCSRWVELEPTLAYSSSYYDKGYVDTYVNYDMDNYGYND